MVGGCLCGGSFSRRRRRHLFVLQHVQNNVSPPIPPLTSSQSHREAMEREAVARAALAAVAAGGPRAMVQTALVVPPCPPLTVDLARAYLYSHFLVEGVNTAVAGKLLRNTVLLRLCAFLCDEQSSSSSWALRTVTNLVDQLCDTFVCERLQGCLNLGIGGDEARTGEATSIATYGTMAFDGKRATIIDGRVMREGEKLDNTVVYSATLDALALAKVNLRVVASVASDRAAYQLLGYRRITDKVNGNDAKAEDEPNADVETRPMGQPTVEGGECLQLTDVLHALGGVIENLLDATGTEEVAQKFRRLGSGIPCTPRKTRIELLHAAVGNDNFPRDWYDYPDTRPGGALNVVVIVHSAFDKLVTVVNAMNDGDEATCQGYEPNEDGIPVKLRLRALTSLAGLLKNPGTGVKVGFVARTTSGLIPVLVASEGSNPGLLPRHIRGLQKWAETMRAVCANEDYARKFIPADKYGEYLGTDACAADLLVIQEGAQQALEIYDRDVLPFLAHHMSRALVWPGVVRDELKLNNKVLLVDFVGGMPGVDGASIEVEQAFDAYLRAAAIVTGAPEAVDFWEGDMGAGVELKPLQKPSLRIAAQTPCESIMERSFRRGLQMTKEQNRMADDLRRVQYRIRGNSVDMAPWLERRVGESLARTPSRACPLGAGCPVVSFDRVHGMTHSHE